jgi:hypothetical protein
MYLLGNEYQERLLDILDNVSVRSIGSSVISIENFGPRVGSPKSGVG